MPVTLDKLERREWIIVESAGQKIFGILHRPTYCERPPPVVLLFHGFASSKHGSNRCYVKLAENFAKEGIATLRFDFRGSGDSDGDLSEMTFEDLLADALAVLENLEGIDGIDPNRVALFGASLGGTLAILSAARYGSIKALALWAPVASGEIWYRDFLIQNPQYLHADPAQVLASYRGIQLHPLFREQFGQMAAWKTMHQLTHIPTLMMHGERDQTITMAHQEAFRHSCASNREVRFVKYADGEHSLGFSPHFPDVVKESLCWFQKHL